MSILNIVNGLATGQTFTIPLHDFALVLGISQEQTFSQICGLSADWDCVERHLVGDLWNVFLANIKADAPNVTLHMYRAAGACVFGPVVTPQAAAKKLAVKTTKP